MCGRPACQCELGFFRDASGHCVSEQECLLCKLPVTSPPIWNNSNLTMPPYIPMFNSSFPSLNFTMLNSSMGCNYLPGNIPMGNGTNMTMCPPPPPRGRRRDF
ncbi:unnamed protein product [Nippostrongylus brasiliensis]|uniref:EB domain-containing protein n=1 Tax=Nippostrongylus brasiliensis TaxID=27835 RepID=A0A0N4XIK5_NIPBR|nr:unnamed protein product [Nippostrongylus brasiliensis]